MKLGRRTFFHDVLDIPEGKVGEFEVAHVHKPAGSPVPTSNFRTAFHRGQANPQLTFTHPTRWHELAEGGGVWMTDFPIEQIQIDEEIHGFTGRVLVGGLGLGYAVTALAMKPRVREVVVVEKQPEVIALVAEHVVAMDPEKRKKVRVVEADLFDYLRAGAGGVPFKCGFYDIWTSDGEFTFHKTVVPLRQLSKNLVEHVTCWNETVMRSQLVLGLRSRLLFTGISRRAPDLWPASEEGLSVEALAEGLPESTGAAMFINWACPFWRWVQRAKPTEEQAMAKALEYVKYYAIVPQDFLEHVVLG